ncbi:MAG TPA: hypothetical protein VGO18_13260 [Steroidobacteraceae bacterium]|jgi:hypothetical protein|nr:hypothetical protein [Steroidobacteraceae bacterium]
MTHSAVRIAPALVLASLTCGCDQLGLGNKAPASDGAPPVQELQKISYMSSSDSPAKSRKLYSHYEEARTCGDFELALRWNRPPNVAGGVFNKKIVYLTSGVPNELAKDSEVFIIGTIEQGKSLGSGTQGWLLRMRDGTVVQAIEMQNFLEKEEQAAQDGKRVALEKPNKPGRAFCGQGVYQGVAGKDPDHPEKPIPLVSILFAMDRES